MKYLAFIITTSDIHEVYSIIFTLLLGQDFDFKTFVYALLRRKAINKVSNKLVI